MVGADHWLVLGLVNALQWPDHFQIEISSLLALLLSVVCLVLFAYYLANRCVVLLVALVDVRDQGALARQEGAAYLECLSVPVLALGLDLDRVDIWIVPHVHQEAQFCRDAKVRDCEETDFLNY